MLIEGILKKIAKKWKLDKLIKYVEEPNDADERIDELERTVFQQGRLIEFILKENKQEKQ
tara:strand:+ start:53 stop:232 length:180 start_codon:yes stop_codon:yes gene_type:complete